MSAGMAASGLEDSAGTGGRVKSNSTNSCGPHEIQQFWCWLTRDVLAVNEFVVLFILTAICMLSVEL